MQTDIYILIDEMENVAVTFPERAMEIEEKLINKYGKEKFELSLNNYYNNK